MNGYEILIDSYERLLKNGGIDEKFAKEQIKALKPFAERTEEEIIRMFDSGAFNEVLKAYCRKAMINTGIEEKKINAVMDELKCLLETIEANEIMKK